VPLILTDGSLRLQFDQGTAPPAGFPKIPAAAAELEQVFHLTPDGTRPWFIARRSDGVLVQWAQGDAPYQPAASSWRTVAAGNGNAGGIASDGSVIAWTIDGPMAVAGAPANAQQLTLGAGWGAAIDVQGTLHSLGLGAGAPPALPDLGPLLSVAALPFSTAANPRLAAIRKPHRNVGLLCRRDGAVREDLLRPRRHRRAARRRLGRPLELQLGGDEAHPGRVRRGPVALVEHRHLER
jgi:hypothetical protein